MSEFNFRTSGPIGFGLRRLIDRNPLHAALIDRWRVQSNPAIPTVGVRLAPDLRVELIFNPDFVAGLQADELASVLQHEAHHVIFSHLSMTPEQYPDSKALTIAQEVTANEFITGPLPGTPVVLAQFPDLPLFESTAERYARLQNRRRCSSVGSSCRIEPIRVSKRVWQTLLASDLHGSLVELPGNLRAAALEQLGELARADVGLDDAMRLLALPNAGRTRADWRSILRRFVWSLSQPEISRRRPSRRFPQLVGVVPGRVSRPRRPRLLAVIDTSGSMIHDDVLAAIRAELQSLGNLSDLLIVECDTKIRREYKFTGDISGVVGGGGTAFHAPLSDEFLRSRHVDGVAYFTDGFGTAPTNPPKAKVLWCLLSDAARPANWGFVARLPHAKSGQVTAMAAR